MGEVRRIVLDGAEGDRWRWHDLVNVSDRGTCRIAMKGLEVGDELVVDVARNGRGWKIERIVEAPDHTWCASQSGDRPAVDEGHWEPFHWTAPRVGEVRSALDRFTNRATADHDVGITAKRRPAVIVWVNDTYEQVGLRFIYGTNSAKRREGLARRLGDWQQAGLRKASVVEQLVNVRPFGELSAALGRLSSDDRRWACRVPRNSRC